MKRNLAMHKHDLTTISGMVMLADEAKESARNSREKEKVSIRFSITSHDYVGRAPSPARSPLAPLPWRNEGVWLKTAIEILTTAKSLAFARPYVRH